MIDGIDSALPSKYGLGAVIGTLATTELGTVWS